MILTRKFFKLLFTLGQLSLLVSCRNGNPQVTYTSSLKTPQLTDVAASTTLSQPILPPAYVVAPIQVLQSDKYSEGVVFDDQNNLFFSQTKAGTITVLAPDGSRPRIWARVPGANGHKIMPDGTHIVAAKNSVVQLDANGKLLKVVAKEFKGKPLIYPNDLTLDTRDGFYFTDSGSTETPNGSVYYVDSTGKINSVATGIAFANGIVLTPNGKQLFVAESNKNRVLVYDVLSPGKVGSQKVFSNLPVKQGDQIDHKPDGMCLDQMGNLYVAHYGMGQVEVLNPEGKLIRRYSTGNLTTSNVAFGGSKLDQLFVTGGIKTEAGYGAIQRLNLDVPGLDIRPTKQRVTSNLNEVNF
ncbi:SMP-30/gluconolactonase/LRE family protein [Aetokthonos hydrillicola Thurmond2011]|jgi:gluconolactonase|uniref:SMP-30/gluconolactonase/LRE family protein n=2 Tax=Aetokthonos TaxID=1550243 RepID=A0AAP5I2D2_9CYAN|nr:SMP-30/gluconolactonase/LRE family protein [Aetokthonos hydrillicola]MBO3459390.1 SMP-30/gluconolactonase/LRE family protein [Aetokthonos hydrillicola CCALA 1050]MBW4586536.1 SMP-30/gluconolactonase/LRE family protein [Aetokthonos hydrillicola CCALA 1050]MDR9893519.1 SMP-30/gluconolactonase/LRE family protein [Aetokthonos hydrillicola Thurmond2011]